MTCSVTPQLLLLLFAGLLLPAVLTAGYPQAAAPTLWQEPPELPSGLEPIETTPSIRLSDVTGVPADTSEPDPTHEDPLGNGDGAPGALQEARSFLCHHQSCSRNGVCKYLRYRRWNSCTKWATISPGTTGTMSLLFSAGSLGPGAVAAIVLAALLGTSVLIALIVITLRKFSAP